MLRALVYIVPIALLIYALIDFSRSLPSERADLPTPAWVLLIILLPVVGPLAWILVSRSRRSGEHVPSSTGPTRPRPSTPARPVPPRPTPPRRGPGTRAPDDDPDFLWRLEQEGRRRAQRERRRTDHPDQGGATPGTGSAGSAGSADDADSADRTDGPDGTDGGHGAGRRRTDDSGPDESA